MIAARANGTTKVWSWPVAVCCGAAIYRCILSFATGGFEYTAGIESPEYSGNCPAAYRREAAGPKNDS